MLSGRDSLNRLTARNIPIWFTMAFQGGAVNAGGFLAAHRFVSHTTGFATSLGLELERESLATAIGVATVPLFFLAGCVISALLVDRPQLLSRRPHPNWALFFLAVLHVAVFVLSVEGFFGPFGATTNPVRAFVLLATLALACGLQNALAGTASGSIVRTTHLTGPTTDLGVGLVRAFSHRDAKDRRDEVRIAWLRMGLIASFILGSTVGAFVFLRFGSWGFSLPAALSLGLWLLMVNRQWRATPVLHPVRPERQVS